MKKNRNKTTASLLFPLFFFLFSCTFDYGEGESSDDGRPDLVMENVEYVRVRSANPLARVRAERVERYESQDLIRLYRFDFEQYGERGEEVNIFGRADNAEVGIESGDIFLERNVRLELRTEDIILETYQLEWKDEPRTVSAGEYNEVLIYRDNGTIFSGIGFSADARWRTWEFTGRVGGTYVHDDDDEEEE
jgi:LPS export ABC transporter protein LptC